MRGTTIVFGIMLVSLLFFGCLFWGEQQNITVETNQTNQTPVVVKNPSFMITNPADGASILVAEETGDVTLTLSTQNLIVKQPGTAAKAGEGHFRVTIDGGSPVTVTSKSYVLSGLELGEHTVKVELLNNDRTQYSPPISQEVSFSLEKEQPPEYVSQHYTVDIEDFSYDPAAITVKVGDSITFTNTGAYPRSATCFLEGREVFDSDVLAPGASATITFDEIMECQYYSTTHFAMKGTVKVVGNE